MAHLPKMPLKIFDTRVLAKGVPATGESSTPRDSRQFTRMRTCTSAAMPRAGAVFVPRITNLRRRGLLLREVDADRRRPRRCDGGAHLALAVLRILEDDLPDSERQLEVGD